MIRLPSASPLLRLGIAMEICYLSLSALSSFSVFSATPPNFSEPIGMLFIFLFLTIFLFVLVRELPWFYRMDNPCSMRMILLFAILFVLTLLFSLPLTSADLYLYAFQNRLMTLYHQNPFLVPPITFQHDALVFWNFEDWLRLTTAYGPLWHLSSSIFSFLASSVWGSTVLLKFWTASFFLGSVFLTYLILGKIDQRRRVLGTLLVAWNPVLLMEYVQNGHNDILMIFFLLLSAWFFIRQKKLWAVVFLGFAIAIKSYAVLFLPFYFYLFWRSDACEKGRWWSNGWRVLSAIAVFMAIIIVFTFPFGGWREVFVLGVKSHAGLFYAPSYSYGLLPLILNFLGSFQISWLSWLNNASSSLLLLLLFFGGIMIWIVHSPITSNQQWFHRISIALMFYFFLFAPVTRSWHLAWILPFAIIAFALDEKEGHGRSLWILVTFFASIYYIFPPLFVIIVVLMIWIAGKFYVGSGQQWLQKISNFFTSDVRS